MAQCNPVNSNTYLSPHLSKHRIAAALSAVVLTMVTSCAFALKSDNDQPMDVTAGTSRIEGDKEISAKKTIYLHGNVQMVQGTIRAHGADAVVYMDKDTTTANAGANNEKSKVKRLVLTGQLAHMEQQQDNNSGLMTGDAEKLDYKIDTHLVEMTGNVTVVQQKQGTFHGEHMIYNTLTGEMLSGDESATSRVHIILQPKEDKTPATKPTDTTKPASTSGTSTPTKTPDKTKKKKTTPVTTDSSNDNAPTTDGP